MRKYVAVATIASWSILHVSSAAADGARLPFRMPHCPVPLTVSVPGVFVGSNLDPMILDDFSAVPHRHGEYVLAVRSPSEPVTLLILEPDGTSSLQGKITPAQFNDLKAAFLAENPIGVKQDAKEQLAKEGNAFSDARVLTSSSDASSATVTTVLKDSTPSAGLEAISSYKIGYVRQCVVGAVLVAPASGMPRERLEELSRSISFD